MSRLLGESALNSAVELAVDKDGTLELSITFSCELDADGGGLEHPGKCNCFRFCSLRISMLRFAAICSEKEKKTFLSQGTADCTLATVDLSNLALG